MLISSVQTELPHLKQYVFNGEVYDTYEVLVGMKARLNRSDLRLFPAGFLFDTETLPENFNPNFYDGTGNFVPFLKEHQEKFVLIDQRYVFHLQFNVYADCFTDGLPEELLQRLVHVKSLTISGKVNEVEQLVKVLDILGRGLSFIEIDSSLLNQEFFNRLPKWCPILNELSIEEEEPLDPTFILRFKSLKVVHLHQHQHQLNEEIAEECFRKYENFVSCLLCDQDACLKTLRSTRNPTKLDKFKDDSYCKKKEKLNIQYKPQNVSSLSLPTISLSGVFSSPDCSESEF